MNLLSYIYLIVALLVLLLIIYNQLRIRQVRRDLRLRLPIILVIVGLPHLVSYINSEQGNLLTPVTVLAGLLVLAVGMGVLRAYTVRLWSENREVFRRGTWITVVLWILTAGLHLAIAQFGHVGESTLLIDYGITLIVQRWVILTRAQSLFMNSQV